MSDSSGLKRLCSPPRRGVNHCVFASVAVATIITLCSKPAFAYLDPGTLGMFFQMLIAIVAGALLFFKIGWTRVKSFLKKMFNPRR